MPAITRIGDAEIVHCSPPFRAEGSPDVFCNGIPISREGDSNVVHLMPVPGLPPCIPHTAPISKGSSTVFINGKGCGRVGDPTCTAVSEGSPNCFAGG